jgi:hypothetical protein
VKPLTPNLPRPAIDETRQHRRFADVVENEGDITRSQNLDRRKRRQESLRHNIRLQDGQRADPYAETLDHGLQGDEEMVENAPALVRPVGEPGALEPIRPIAGTRLAGQKHVGFNVGWVAKRRSFEQRRTDD